jgi:hypothetical protein
MNTWKPDRILKVLIFWITYLFVFSWLPLVRILMDGESYQWGTLHFGRMFSANSMSADAWLLVVKSALLAWILYLGLRGAGVLFRGLLLVWNMTMSADVIYQVITNPGGFEFHGDTLGIHLNLGVSVIAVVAGMTLLSVYWIGWMAPTRAAEVAPVWAPRNKTLLTAFVLLLPVQFILLRFGEPHGTTDAIGVFITIGQCPLLAMALFPWTSDSES